MSDSNLVSGFFFVELSESVVGVCSYLSFCLVAGGKWTTYRAMASDAVDQVIIIFVSHQNEELFFVLSILN